IKSPQTMNPVDVLAVLGIEAAGIDVTVVRDAAIAAGAGLSDGASFKSDASGKPQLSSKSGDVSKTTSAMQKALGIDRDIPKQDLLAPEKVQMLEMPESAHDRIVGLIKGATKSIDLELYQLTDPTIIDALIDAKKRGLKVRVMLEPKTVGAQNYVAM